MPAYAILGVTGSVGGALVKILLDKDIPIHAYCRSRQKLLEQQPDIDKNQKVRIFEGSLDDKQLLSHCIEGTRAVFVAIAVKGNQPGLTIAQDTAHHVIAAIKMLQSSQGLPKLIILSSASTDHRLMTAVPHFLLDTLYCTCSYIYDDLKAAEKIYRSEDAWLTAIFIKPGALSNDAQKGHKLSTEVAKSPVSFLDLAGGMLDIASQDGDRYDWKGVAVNAASDNVAFPWEAPFVLSKGFIIHFLPWAYKYIG